MSSFVTLALRVRLEYRNKWQITVLFQVIQPVPYEKLVWHLKPNIAQRYIHEPARPFVEQSAYFHTCGLFGLQVLYQVIECHAGVNNVLDQDDVLFIKAEVKVLGYL